MAPDVLVNIDIYLSEISRLKLNKVVIFKSHVETFYLFCTSVDKTLMKTNTLVFAMTLMLITGCGLKVINPNEPNNKGTLALDVSEGSPKLVATYTCNLESMGNRFSAVGKSEAEARQEVVAKCKDRTLISNCKLDKAKCSKN